MRPTDDADTVLDVRAEPGILRDVTSQLVSLGFEPEGTSPQGHQHRWRKGAAVIDVLIPENLGERASSRTGAGGGTTIATPAAQQALDRTMAVAVSVGGRQGWVRRPSLLGSLVAKAAAYGVPLDRARTRHLTDLLVLATLVRPDDQVGQATKRDRRYLGNALGALVHHPELVAGVEGAADGLARVRLALGLTPAPTPLAGQSGTAPFAPRRRPRR